MKDGKAFVATTCKGEACSAVWSISPVSAVKPVQLAYFKHGQIEGITYDEKSKSITGIFDAGGKPTKMVRIKLK